ncbi:MAG TPA: tetratricopeptide repeat protein, partial [Terriglobia bacterium]|nr:tetratricopeptide repeat protein [Terriglobia bacterium]
DGKEAGIRDLEIAAAKGVRAVVDARMLLVVVYGREQKYDKALKLLDELHAKYPRNFMLEMSKASLYTKMKRWDLAAQSYRQITEKIATRKDGYERMRIEKVYYELANSDFQAQKFDEATRTFGLVASGSAATPSEKAHAHLWMGRMSDSRRNRADALKHYNAVLGLDVDSEIKSDAQRLIRKPFGSP